MAALYATFIFGHLADHQNVQFEVAVAAPGLPQLQAARLGSASCDFADFFAAAMVGAILAREGRDQLLAAAATFVVTQAFEQLFLVVHILPATVPPAVVLLAMEACRSGRPGKRRERIAAVAEAQEPALPVAHEVDGRARVVRDQHGGRGEV